VIAVVPNNTDEPMEESLVAAAQRGDRAAFDALVREHQRAVFAFSWQRVRDVEAARELTQQTLVRAYEGLSQFRGEARFRTWLFSIAVRLCIDAQKKRKDVEHQPQETAGAPALLEARERQLLLRRAVARLPEKQRLVVELRAFEELSFKEIGAVLEVSEDAAKMNFHHALKKLREELSHE
jgi:RNA polymerase sigma-70 factor (ECF subfamily)